MVEASVEQEKDESEADSDYNSMKITGNLITDNILQPVGCRSISVAAAGTNGNFPSPVHFELMRIFDAKIRPKTASKGAQNLFLKLAGPAALHFNEKIKYSHFLNTFREILRISRTKPLTYVVVHAKRDGKITERDAVRVTHSPKYMGLPALADGAFLSYEEIKRGIFIKLRYCATETHDDFPIESVYKIKLPISPIVLSKYLARSPPSTFADPSVETELKRDRILNRLIPILDAQVGMFGGAPSTAMTNYDSDFRYVDISSTIQYAIETLLEQCKSCFLVNIHNVEGSNAVLTLKQLRNGVIEEAFTLPPNLPCYVFGIAPAANEVFTVTIGRRAFLSQIVPVEEGLYKLQCSMVLRPEGKKLWVDVHPWKYASFDDLLFQYDPEGLMEPTMHHTASSNYTVTELVRSEFANAVSDLLALSYTRLKQCSTCGTGKVGCFLCRGTNFRFGYSTPLKALQKEAEPDALACHIRIQVEGAEKMYKVIIAKDAVAWRSMSTWAKTTEWGTKVVWLDDTYLVISPMPNDGPIITKYSHSAQKLLVIKAATRHVVISPARKIYPLEPRIEGGGTTIPVRTPMGVGNFLTGIVEREVMRTRVHVPLTLPQNIRPLNQPTFNTFRDRCVSEGITEDQMNRAALLKARYEVIFDAVPRLAVPDDISLYRYFCAELKLRPSVDLIILLKSMNPQYADFNDAMQAMVRTNGSPITADILHALITKMRRILSKFE